MTTHAQSTIMGGLLPVFDEYEINLRVELATRLTEEKLQLGTGLERIPWYYYDRALILYRQGHRTDDSDLITRGHKAAVMYRDAFRPDDDPINWQFPRGLAMHHALTGDSETLQRLKQMTANCYMPYYLDYLDGSQPDRNNPRGTDNRIQAYILTHFCVMHGMRVFEIPNPNGDERTTTEMARFCLDAILESQDDEGNFAAHMKQKSPFMTGLLLDALLLYYNLVEEDSRIPVAIEKSATFMWDNYRIRDAFQYDPGTMVPGDYNRFPAPDLNMLICPAMAWLGGPGGVEIWVQQGDTIFKGGVRSGAHAGDAKHFNQQYFIGMEYTGWRVNP
jgi:hypothetical protein